MILFYPNHIIFCFLSYFIIILPDCNPFLLCFWVFINRGADYQYIKFNNDSFFFGIFSILLIFCSNDQKTEALLQAVLKDG